MSNFNDFEINFKAKDEASATIEKLGKSLDSLQNKLKAIGKIEMPFASSSDTKGIKELVDSLKDLQKEFTKTQNVSKKLKTPKLSAKQLKDAQKSQQYSKIASNAFGSFDPRNVTPKRQVQLGTKLDTSTLKAKLGITSSFPQSPIEETLAKLKSIPTPKGIDLTAMSKYEVDTASREPKKSMDEIKQEIDASKKVVIDSTKQVFDKIKEKVEELRANVASTKLTDEQKAKVGTEYAPTSNARMVSSVYDANKEVQQWIESNNGIITQYRVINGMIDSITNKLDTTNTNVKGFSKLLNNIQKATGKLKGFTQYMGRVVLYRAIRAAMAAVKKAISESVQELAKFSKDFNETMSTISTYTDKIKYSISLIAQPFIELFEPILENISEVFTNVANEISRITAKSKGLTTYTKINAKYAKDYANSLSSSKLSFDSFSTLSTSDYFKNANVEEETTEELNDTETSLIDVILEVKEIISTIIQEFGPILKDVGSSMLDILKALLPLISPLVKIIKTIYDTVLKPLLTILTSVVNVVSSVLEPILDLVSSLKVLQILSSAINAIATIISTIYNAIASVFSGFKGIFSKIFSSFTSKGEAKQVRVSEDKYANFASGGVIAPSNIIRTNENGTPEWLGKIGTNTAVVNDSQMSDIMYQAVYSAVRDSYGSNGTNITIDFKDVDNNSVARVLAKSMANQFAKQNLKVKY